MRPLVAPLRGVAAVELPALADVCTQSLEPSGSRALLILRSSSGVGRVGFTVEVDEDGGIPRSVDFDAEELEDAKWFDKAFVAQSLKAQGDSD